MLDIDEQLSAMVQGAIGSGCLLSAEPRAVSELLHQAQTWKDEAEKQQAKVERLRAALERIDSIGAGVSFLMTSSPNFLGERLFECREIARAALTEQE